MLYLRGPTARGQHQPRLIPGTLGLKSPESGHPFSMSWTQGILVYREWHSREAPLPELRMS